MKKIIVLALLTVMQVSYGQNQCDPFRYSDDVFELVQNKLKAINAKFIQENQNFATAKKDQDGSGYSQKLILFPEYDSDGKEYLVMNITAETLSDPYLSLNIRDKQNSNYGVYPLALIIESQGMQCREDCEVCGFTLSFAHYGEVEEYEPVKNLGYLGYVNQDTDQKVSSNLLDAFFGEGKTQLEFFVLTTND